MQDRNRGLLYASPLLLWITIFFAVPSAIVVLYSFLERGTYGGVKWNLSFEAYRNFIDPNFLHVLWITFYISVAVSIIAIVLALPTAYFIARSRRRNLLLMLIIIPFWTNFLIRVYAFIALLGNNGFVNRGLMEVFGLTEPVQMLYNVGAVVLITLYTYLPYAILPLYASIEKFDFSLLEAARDLGASKFQAMWKVFVPGIRPGLMTALLFTFIPAMGSYAVPQLVGGKDSMMLGNVIARELTVTRNWPMASAISVVLMAVTAVGIVLFMRYSAREDEHGA